MRPGAVTLGGPRAGGKGLTMAVLAAIGHALAVAGSMTWQITWSLILGFTLSAIVQAVVRSEQFKMRRVPPPALSASKN